MTMGTGGAPILRNRYFLYATEFFAGMAVMAVELGASRLMAPYFSSSQIVWTMIIGTIMIAMALGNVWGGKLADKDPDPAKLYRRLIIAAVWIALIPLVGKYIIMVIAGMLIVAIDIHLLIWASFLTCLVLFVFPLFLLGTVTPSLVKYAVNSLDSTGSIVGMLGACNTIGSIIGTFLPTFVTIPAVGTAVTFIIFSGVLLVIGLIYFISSGGNKGPLALGALVFLIASVFGSSSHFAFWEEGLTYEGESMYNYLQVRDTPRSTILSTNVLFGVQSIRMKGDELTGMYYDYALAGPVLAGISEKENPKILILGMGTGTFASQCRKYFPNAAIEGVEIDEAITGLSHKYFDLPSDIPVTTYDGRAFLAGTGEKYDVILVDAYQDITIPFQMSSREFFGLVRDHLNPSGVMVVNMNLKTNGEGEINEYLLNSMGTAFSHVYTADVPNQTNREVYAWNDSSLADSFEKNRLSLKDHDLRTLMGEVRLAAAPHAQGDHIFTDDKAPVEFMGMQALDAMMREEIGPYKEAYRIGGVRGLLDAVL